MKVKKGVKCLFRCFSFRRRNFIRVSRIQVGEGKAENRAAHAVRLAPTPFDLLFSSLQLVRSAQPEGGSRRSEVLRGTSEDAVAVCQRNPALHASDPS